jgi:eukaryotic-like serine/threonine-protein kinase
MHPPPGGPTPSLTAESVELQPGATLSHYQVQARIGRGGMGTVYRARDTRLERDVAIKVINAEIAADADRIARFHREATILAALNHPGIVVIHDTGQEKGLSYLVTELVDGTTLRTVLRDDGAVGSRRVIEIAAQIADALNAAHTLGILHRDLKPENVMFTRQGRAKLLDFGLAKSREMNGGRDVTRTVLNTEAGVVMGTVGYMSPEQVRGEALDARSDIFSLGIMLHEMLSGARPFEGGTTADVVSAVLRNDPPPLPASVPAALGTIVQRCLHRQPSERFQSASDLAFALRNVAGSTAAVPAAGTPASSRSSRWLTLLPAVTALAAVGLAALVVYRALVAAAGDGTFQLRPFATESHGEAQPAWSPDGRSLAYVAAIDGRQHLFVKGVNTLSAVQVLRCPALCDTVGWSADGSRIVYNSRTTHLDARLWSVARTGGGPAPLFKEDVQLLASAFSPDGKRLAILRVIPSPDGVGQKYGLFLSEPPGADPVRFDPFPLLNLITPTRIAWAADSTRLLVFSAGSARVDVVALGDRSVRPLPVEGRVDFSWGRDPRFAVAARSSLTATRSGLEWFDIETGRFSPLASSESVLTSPSVSPDGTRVAYTAGDLDYDLVDIPLDGSPLRPLLASRLPEHSVHYSPRSDEFAYVAAGEASEIRIRHPATLAERVIVSRADFAGRPGPTRFAAAAFSRDGTKLAYNYNFAIWISPSNGGAPAKLTSESGEFAAEWSPDDAWVAFNYARPFFSGLVKVRVGAGEPEVRLRQGICGPVAPAWSPDGAWIACGRPPKGLDLVPANGGPPRFLGEQYEPLAAWSRDPDRLYVIRASEGRRELGELTWRSGAFRPISPIPADFEINNAVSWAGRLSLSHDGKSLVTAVSRATGDIWILDGLRPPRTWWKRLLGR